jgi:hypothetical protein
VQLERFTRMTEHNLFYYRYTSFTNSQRPLLKVAALYFDKLYILDPAANRITGGNLRLTPHGGALEGTGSISRLRCSHPKEKSC